jgi:uncharacterized protein
MAENNALSRRRWLQAAGGAAVAGWVGGNGAAQAPPKPMKPGRIDAHMHLEWAGWRAAKPVRPQRTRKSRPGWLESVATARPERAAEYRRLVSSLKSYDEYADAFVREMDEADIGVACVHAMDRELEGYYRVPYWDILRQIAAARDRYPDRFVLFCGIDPRRGARGVDLLERAVKELGYRGMGEMLPHYHLFSPDDARVVYPLYRKCMELNIPVSTNTSSIPGSAIAKVCDPMLLEAVNYDFPDLNICLSSAGLPYWFETALMFATQKPGLYIDTADWQAVDEYNIRLYLQLLRRAMDSACRYKIMYGSDNPVYRAMYNEKEWIDIVVNDAPKYGFKFTSEELDLYFRRNFEDFLNGVPA